RRHGGAGRNHPRGYACPRSTRELASNRCSVCPLQIQEAGGSAMFKRILLGALIGALFTAVDGAVVGVLAKAFFAEDDTWRVVGLWTFCFAVVGAILGALLGGFWTSLVERLMLRTPPESPDRETGPAR